MLEIWPFKDLSLINNDPPIGLLDFAGLCWDLYTDKEKPPLVKGWELILLPPSSLTDENYFAAAYRYKYQADEKSKPVNLIVLAHRGTEKLVDFFHDFYVWLEKVPIHFFNKTIPFLHTLVDYFDDLAHRTKEMYIFFGNTGHSLGAIYAELTSAYIINKTSCYVNTISFESPGSVPLFQALIQQGLFDPFTIAYFQQPGYVTCLYSDVNAINTCNTHLSLSALPNPKIAPYQYIKIPLYPSRDYYFFEFTMHNQHKISYFYYYLKANPLKISNLAQHPTQSFIWPVGFENGYRFYLTYENHPGYWDDYINEFWDEHPEIHAQYDVIEAFKEYFMKTFLIHKKDNPIIPNHSDKSAIKQMNLYSFFASDSTTKMNDKLVTAVFCDNVLLAENLLKQGANANYADNVRQYTSLHIAAINGNCVMLERLLTYNANLDAKDISGNTALHLIAKEGKKNCLELIEQLVRVGANTELKNNKGETCYDIIKAKHPNLANDVESILNKAYIHIEKEPNIATESNMRKCSIM